jgi:hypothetical protein
MLAIEDRLFEGNRRVKIPTGLSAVIFPDISPSVSNLEQYSILAEFSLSLLTISGHPTFQFAAGFSEGSCVCVKTLSLFDQPNLLSPKFVSRMPGSVIGQWLWCCARAYSNLKTHMHIASYRHVRYARSSDDSDAVMDLCISLESLLDTQTEVSFRFGISLVRVTGERGQSAEENAKLLSDLYDVRSKLAHGDPTAIRRLDKIRPKLPQIRVLAKKILTCYVIFLSNHSREDWQAHLRKCLFN